MPLYWQIIKCYFWVVRTTNGGGGSRAASQLFVKKTSTFCFGFHSILKLQTRKDKNCGGIRGKTIIIFPYRGIISKKNPWTKSTTFFYVADLQRYWAPHLQIFLMHTANLRFLRESLVVVLSKLLLRILKIINKTLIIIFSVNW